MSVSDGQDANESTFNDAFVSKVDDSTTVGQINLANVNAASGSTVTNVQREINSLDSFTGRAAGSAKDVKPNWTNNDVGVSTDDLKVRADNITAEFNAATGHSHTGAAGDGGPLTEASSGIAGIVNAGIQTFTGQKTFEDQVIVQDALFSTSFLTTGALSFAGSFYNSCTADNTSGSNVTILNSLTMGVFLTNASLVSIGVVEWLGGSETKVLINKTGASVTIKHAYTSGAGDSDVHCPNAVDFTLLNNCMIVLQYVETYSAWYITGGSFLSPLTTKGDVYTFSTVDARLAVGTNGQVLTADSGEVTGLKWTTVTGTGDVVGPASSTDNALVRFDTTTGKLLQNSNATLSDNGAMSLDGTADAVQLNVQGHSTQTSNIINVEKSDGTDLFSVTNTAGTLIRGTTTNDSAATGFVGEYVESTSSANGNFPTTATWGDMTSISLTAGDWDVSASFNTLRNGATVTDNSIGISTTSGNSTSGMVVGNNWLTGAHSVAGEYDANLQIHNYRISIAATTTVYLKMSAVYTVATYQYDGYRLSARRVR